MTLRPFFPFYGSKWNIARYYPAPGEGLVCEPFAGSAGYSCFYEPKQVTLVDADEIICGVWSYLTRVTASEIEALPDMPDVGANVDDYEIPQEAKWLIGFWLNRGSAQPKKSRTAFGARHDRAQLLWGAKAKARIIEQVDRIRHWRVIHGHFSMAPAAETYFVDPPYVDKGKFYRKRFDKHDLLGTWCRHAHGNVIACEGPGAEWLPFRPLGSFKSTKGRALERVWTSMD